MPRPSIVPAILQMLEPYLAAKAQEFTDLTAAMKAAGNPLDATPTLPSTVDGKINILGIGRALDLPATSRQHLYKPEIVALLNAAAESQGLKGIGSRGEDDADDRLAKVQAKLSDCLRQAAERETLIFRLRQENDGLRKQLALLAETGMVMRTGAI